MGYGKNLKEILKEKGMKVPELSRRTNIPQTTIYAIINKDINNVSLSNVKKIEAVLGKIPVWPKAKNDNAGTDDIIESLIMQWAKQKGFSTDFAFDPKREHQKVLFVGVAKNLARSFYPEDFAQIKQSVYKQLDEMCIYKEGV